MLLKITIFAALICAFTARAQDDTAHFFTDILEWKEIDTMSRNEFLDVYEAQPKSFDQPLYTYGYEDSSEWELVINAYIDYPEMIQPVVHSVDVNSDGDKDIVLSFYAGHEYSFVGFYIYKNGKYNCVFTDNGQFYGVYKNGDVCYEKPACCDDPTDDYFRISISKKGEVEAIDEVSIQVDP